jgi:hypothetical protein
VNRVSEEEVKPIEQKESLRSKFRVEKERLIWIDQARGFVMFFLVLTEILPNCWTTACWTNNGIVKALAGFFLDHPSPQLTVQYIDFYDIGVPAFFFVIGLLMAVSFKKRIQTHGKGSAIANSVLRWGLFYLLGEMIIFFTYKQGFGAITEIAPGVYWYVVSWDVIPALGFVGLCAIPFMFLPIKTRLVLAYCMMTAFQIMLFIPQTYMRAYAEASVHGGIIGGFFVMTSIVLVGSCVGEYFLLNKETPLPKKYKMLALLAIVNLAIGLGLWLIPGGYPNKRQSSMGWATLSIAVIIFALFGFIALNNKKPHHTVVLEAYGMNPFIMYALCVMPNAILAAIFPILKTSNIVQIEFWVIMEAIIAAVALTLYKFHKAISATKVVATIIIILIPIGILAVAFHLL